MLDKNNRGNLKPFINLIYVSAMGHATGGRNDIPNRLKRKFYAFNLL